MNVYDAKADRVIIFGGYYGGPIGGELHTYNDTWAYSVDSNEWTNLRPRVHPHAGWLLRSAYDSRSARTIMFGGYDNVTGLQTDETWAFDFGNNSWTNRSPAIHPGIRTRQGMAYDAESDRTIIFGGLDPWYNRYLNETWAYEFGANTWTNMTRAVAPSPRRSMGMAYSPQADRIILFGGLNLNTHTAFNDTWAYDYGANSWTNLSPPGAPSARFGLGFVYDAGIDRFLMFGGFRGTTGGLSDETWAYDYGNNSWSRVTTNEPPQPLYLQAMAYDVASAQTILFGGSFIPPNGFFLEANETWSLATHPQAPSAPEWLYATAGKGNVTLRWLPPRYDGMSPVKTYRLYRGPDEGNLSLIAEFGDVRSSLDTNVSNGVRYVYRVSAVNWIGEGPPSVAASATPDGDPPLTTATLSGCRAPSGWFTCAVATVELTAVDNSSGIAETRYRIDSGPWRTYDGRFYVAHDGIHAVDFYSIDTVGNVEVTRTVSVSIDSVPPTSRAVLSGSPFDAYWWTSNVAIELNATDATSGVASISYRLDGSDWGPYVSPVGAGNGPHRFDFFASDVAGLSEEAHTILFGVDTDVPSGGFTLSGARGADDWYLGPVRVSIDAADPTSGVSVSYRLDEGAWTVYDRPFAVDRDGAHVVEFLAVDAAGHSLPGSTSFSIDATAPQTEGTVDGPAGSGGWYTGPVTVSLTGLDAQSGLAKISYRLDLDPWSTYDGGVRVSQDGVHAIDFFAEDVAGNREATRSVIVRIDATAPHPHASFAGKVGDHGWYRSAVVVEAGAEDVTSGVASVEVQVDDAAWAPYESPLLVGTGTHTIQVAATDVAGLREVTQASVVRVDDRPPSAGNVRPSGHITTADVVVSWSPHDEVSGIDHVEISVDGGGWTRATGESEARVHLSDGPHRISVRVVDVAGNTAEASVDLSVDTNAFSLAGPFNGIPTYGAVAALVAAAGLVALRLRRGR